MATTPEEFIGKEPSLLDLFKLLHKLKISTNTPIEVEPAEISLLDKYVLRVKDGKYYLGGQLQLSINCPITSKKIDDVKKENIKRDYEYGDPCNDLETKSIAEAKLDLEVMQRILEKYYEHQLHELYRPPNKAIRGDKGGEFYQKLAAMPKIGK